MVKDVYLLVMHEPYEEPGAPAPINGVIVHALTGRRADLPVPDGVPRPDSGLPGPAVHAQLRAGQRPPVAGDRRRLEGRDAYARRAYQDARPL
jgi:hypothetical protein